MPATVPMSTLVAGMATLLQWHGSWSHVQFRSGTRSSPESSNINIRFLRAVSGQLQNLGLTGPFVFLLLQFLSLPSAAAVVGPAAYLTAIANAKPGTVIRLKPGLYHGGLPIFALNGTPSRPITIEAADPSQPPRFLARAGKNTVSIVDSSYVHIRNLILDGKGIPVDAVKAEGHSRYAHHITLEGLRILGHGNNQGIVGISTKCPAWGWVIRRNTIVRAGTGMYFGHSDGGAPFFASIIEYNLVYDTLGYNVQIKHQKSRPTDLDALTGVQFTIIRHNVFSKYGNAATGRAARPNLLVGHFPETGNGAKDHYVIYGNFLYVNATEVLFQGEGNIALYANIFVNPLGDAVHIQPHNDVPKDIWLFHNTVVATGDGIVLRGKTEEYVRMLAANVVFSPQGKAKQFEAGNLAGPLALATKYLINPVAFPGPLDLKPISATTVSQQTAFVPPEGLPDATYDFDGRIFQNGDVGAYARLPASVNWVPRVSLKPIVTPDTKEIP